MERNYNELTRKRMLLTGASGMLGQYIRREFTDYDIVALGRSGGSDIVCDLTSQTPSLPAAPFDLVIHAGGTESDAGAWELNHGGTLRLLDALSENPPSEFIYISSTAVYGSPEGHGLDEETRRWAVSEAGKSKARAEDEILSKTASWPTVVTILRPAAVFGRGVSGQMLSLFERVVSGRYIHVRGNNACRSLVTALDLAKAARLAAPLGGVFNVTDGRDHTLISLVEAMSANAGSQKRPVHIPDKWLGAACTLSRHIPGLNDMVNMDFFRQMAEDVTFSSIKLMQTGWKPFDTVAVIARTAPDYPYIDL